VTRISSGNMRKRTQTKSPRGDQKRLKSIRKKPGKTLSMEVRRGISAKEETTVGSLNMPVTHFRRSGVQDPYLGPFANDRGRIQIPWTQGDQKHDFRTKKRTKTVGIKQRFLRLLGHRPESRRITQNRGGWRENVRRSCFG